MMEELRRLWCLLNTNNINLRARYIRSATNVWTQKLSRHLDSDDLKLLDPVLFANLDARFGKHSIDRFAFALNTMLPRYNTMWRDPTCEAVDVLHLSCANWRKKITWCNPPCPLLPDLVRKLHQSGATTTLVDPNGHARFGTNRLPRWPPRT
jgi:hypothetical protein